jgi:hypothetical protein
MNTGLSGCLPHLCSKREDAEETVKEGRLTGSGLTEYLDEGGIFFGYKLLKIEVTCTLWPSFDTYQLYVRLASSLIEF